MLRQAFAFEGCQRDRLCQIRRAAAAFAAVYTFMLHMRRHASALRRHLRCHAVYALRRAPRAYAR